MMGRRKASPESARVGPGGKKGASRVFADEVPGNGETGNLLSVQSGLRALAGNGELLRMAVKYLSAFIAYELLLLCRKKACSCPGISALSDWLVFTN